MSFYGNRVNNYIIENINITPEQIKRLQESFGINDSNYESILESCETYINEASSNIDKLSKAGVDTNGIKNKTRSTSKQAVDIIKKEGINKTSLGKLGELFKNFYTSIAEFLKNFDASSINDGSYDINKLKRSALLLIFVVITNTLISSILTILFGVVGRNLSTWLVCPIIEEAAKQIAIRGEFTLEFTAVFNTYEFTSYVFNMSIIGMPFIKAIKTRLIVVGMHVTTTIIQYLSNNEKLLKSLGLNKEDDRNQVSALGHITGSLIHITWNYLAVYSEAFNRLF